MTIFSPDDRDLAGLAALMPLYMSETYGSAWNGTEQALVSAAASGTVRILIARSRNSDIAGFVAWTHAYDLHWCVSGGTILDLYVRREERGRAVALRLVAAAAAELQRQGGTFLRGTAVDASAGKQLYGRAAVCAPTTECTVSGRAFRELAELESVSGRELVRRLPSVDWNYEA